MFNPKSFQETSLDAIKTFIANHPLATVIVQTESGLEACHIPMYWQDSESQDSELELPSENKQGFLMGHIAKVNPLNNASYLKSPWLIIFQQAGHYISPNWYPSKAMTHKEVPTWNYQSVHISGQAKILNEPEELVQILTRLTAEFESTQPVPWTLNDAPESYIQAMCRGIVGIQIDISDIQAQFKLSQNKSLENRVGVVRGLTEVGTAQAAAMAQLIDVQS